ncbi:MAG TPA: YafY family protein [Egibacteraceae bacterium]|nr:YafY family protein [Egibacteraceae bacterium]
MADPVARLLRLLSLLQTHRHWSAAQLAERLGVSTRTIRRDVDRLRSLGYPVGAVQGVEGGYRLEAGTELPPLLLDDEEAVAIAVGLRTAAGGSVAGIEETSVRALAKLEQVLPSRLRRRINAMHTYTVPLTATSPTVDPETLATITLACRDHERLRFRYRSHDGTVSRRMTEPHRLVSAGRRWYLVAWDVDREDWRTFRVDRLDDLQHTAVWFAERELPAGDAAAYVAEAIRAPFARHHAVVRLHAPLQVVAERLPPWAGVLEAVDDDTCVYRSATDSLEWLALLVGVLGVDFEVLEPAELVDCVRTIGRRFARASGGLLRP